MPNFLNFLYTLDLFVNSLTKSYNDDNRLTKMFSYIKLHTYFFIIIIFYSSAPVFAEEILNLGIPEEQNRDSLTKYNLSGYLSLYEDKSGLLTIEQIIESGKKQFRQNHALYPTFGFSRSSCWGKFTWKGQGSSSQWYLLFDYSMLDRIDLYIVDPETGKYIHKKGGGEIPDSLKDIPHRKPVFLLSSPGYPQNPEKEQEIYFRVQSEDTIELPVFLMDSESFRKNDASLSFIQGLFYGIMLVMMAYNFFLFISIRDKAYLYYSCYILFFVIVQCGIDGFLTQYLFQSHYLWGKISRIISANLAMIMIFKFVESFFNIKSNFPKLRFILPVFTVAATFNMIAGMFNVILANQILLLLMLILVFIFFFFSLKLFNKYAPVRLYFLASFIFSIGAMIWSLKIFGIYLAGITPYALQTGSIFEVTLFSFALAFRFNLLSKEKEEIKIESIKNKQTAEKERMQANFLRKKAGVIEKELMLARDIQMAMLPSKSLNNRIQSLYLPMEQIGGDFYDIITLDENKIGIFISDVSGHGIPAALITVMLRSLISVGISELYIEKENSWLMQPDRFIAHMHNSLQGNISDNFITAFYGVYDLQSKVFKYSSAAHPPPMILEYPDGKEPKLSFLNVSPQAAPFGVHRKNIVSDIISVNQITLKENSRLFMYSDGLMDNVDYDFLNSHTGLDSFKNTILYDIFKSSGKYDLVTFLESLSIQLLLYRDMGLEDDVCVVILEVPPATGL